MSDIHDKIRALLNTANDARGNDHERENAERIAMMLMARHGITKDQLGEKSTIGEGAMFDIAYKWYRLAASAAGHLYGVQPFYQTGGSILRCRFVGRMENVEAAQDTLAFYLLQVEALYKVHLPKGLTKKERADYRKTFKDQCAYRIWERVDRIVREQTSASANMSPDDRGTALMVLDHREQLKSETEDFLNAKFTDRKSMRSITIAQKSATAALDGRRAGDAVDLNRKVNTRPTARLGAN